MPRYFRRQYSDPYSSGPAVVERREYYDGRNSVVEERSLVRPSRPASRASSSIRLVEAPAPRPRMHREESHSEEEYIARSTPRRQYFDKEDWYANRRRDRSGSRQGRCRGRVSSYGGNANLTRLSAMLTFYR
jgi:hypothetical protein